MRKLVFFLGLAVGLAAGANAQDAVAEKKGPDIKFEESTFDFGDIKQGDIVEHVFAFTNSGTEPLILSNVLTTCGCTAPSWPREPVSPGEKGDIKVSFNSAGKVGMQTKVISIVSNSASNSAKITITANVLPEKGAGR